MDAVATGIVCPHCGTEVQVRAPLGAHQLLLAVRLQAALRGVWIDCEQCRTGFVYFSPYRTKPIGRLRDGGAAA